MYLALLFIAASLMATIVLCLIFREGSTGKHGGGFGVVQAQEGGARSLWQWGCGHH